MSQSAVSVPAGKPTEAQAKFKDAPMSSWARARERLAWVLVFPSLLVVAVVALYPLFESVRLSFTNARFGSARAYEYIGFRNYERLFNDSAFRNALKNTIVVLNPSSNPDGHERFAVWYNSIHVGAPDNWSSEKDEPWSIVGRSNHYRFNMNRDVAASTQREVQALVRAMLRWHPMVAVDQHGQTTNYFFPPAARPVNVNIGTQSEKWLDRIGRGNAAAFDKYGWMYFVRDAFDLGGPFYYDSWPSLTGATGMTYETDGGGHLGILWKREDGSLLSFRDGIAKHWVAAMATIETTAAGAQERVRDSIAFRADGSVDAWGSGILFAYYIQGDPGELGPGLHLVTGRVTEHYAPDGSLVRATVSGRSVNLCEVLAAD